MKIAGQFSLKPFENLDKNYSFSIQVKIEKSDRDFRLTYLISGPLNLIEFTPQDPDPHFQENLWQSTCFEAFCSTPGSLAYREFNFSPSGNWWAANFDQYRQRSVDTYFISDSLKISWTNKTSDSAFLEVRLPETFTYQNSSGVEWNLCAILKLLSGEKIHFAIAHSKDKPDFHLRTLFQAKTGSSF